MRFPALFTLLALLIAAPSLQAQEAAPIPAKRLVMTADTDLSGGDLQSIFNTTLDACQASCLDSTTCEAMTFNSRAGSCFLKAGATEAKPYKGALSGRVAVTDGKVLAEGAARAGELRFLSPDDLAAARDAAGAVGTRYPVDTRTVAELQDDATKAEAAGNFAAAAQAAGAVVALTDAPDAWAELARLRLATPDGQSDDHYADLAEAQSAAINAYLRAGTAGARASALYTLAQAFDANGRGRDMIPALKLAQSIQPRDDTAALLEDAIGKYGFNISDTTVDAERASPRICANFNAALATSGVDYSTYVGLPDAGLSVDASDYQICVSGLQHGKRYAITFREGLPSADGEALAKDVVITQYVRDRAPMVVFPGRAYILPRASEAGIPVQAVNASTLDLTLMRVSDRNLVQAIQREYFARPLDTWTMSDFNSSYAVEVWKGRADLAKGDTNADVLTNLPLSEVMKTAGPGIYALQASIPDADPNLTAPAQQWFVISDIGVTTLSGSDGLTVVARSLADAGPKAGAVVTLISQANSILATATTDAQGVARFAAPLMAGTSGATPAMVTVAGGGDFSFLSLTDPEFDLSDRGVTGRAPAPAVDVFLATDRGAYRAGEVLNATILARNAEMRAVEGLPLTVRLVRPDGVEYSRTLAPDQGAGGRAVSLPIGSGAPRGTWRIETFSEDAGHVLASAPFLVEDFLPERIDFTLTMPEGLLPLDTPASIDLSARYLFGAPGAGLALEGDYHVSSVTTLDAFPGYSFGRYDTAPLMASDSLSNLGQTADDGSATIDLPVPAFDSEPTGPLLARYAIRVSEGSGRPVERRIERTFLPAQPIIGIKPAFGPEGPAANSTAAFEVMALGPVGKPVDLSAHWILNRVQTDYQWYAVNGQWSWEPTTTRQKIAEGEVSGPAGTPAKVGASVEWGEYELVVAGQNGSAGTSSVRFYAGGYYSAEAGPSPDMLDLTLDRKDYRPGDTAKVRIVPRAAGVALVSVLSNHVIDLKTVEVKAGENMIDLPVTDAWGAGAYVTAIALKPGDQDARSHLPMRAIGLSYAAVDPGSRRLATTVQVADKVDPRGPLPVSVKVEGVAPGETAWVTVAAVDQGILNLTGTLPPDPAAYYLAQQRLGVGLRDVYGRLIDGQSGLPGAVRSGGDAGGVTLKAPPPTEELVAYFSGPLQVGADGLAKTEYRLPGFNGTVKVMAIAWSKSGVGAASKDVAVHDPVVVTASVPRFLQPGDKASVRLEFVHAEGPAGEMPLSVTADGLTVGQAPASVTLADKGKASLSVPLTAPDAVGEDAKVTVTLTTPDGKSLVKTLAIPVQANDPATSRQVQVALKPGESHPLDATLFDGLRPGTGQATVAIGPLARLNAPAILAQLDRYPYGCTEQMSSKILPLLYFEEMAAAVDQPAAPEVHERVQQAIAAILLNQSAEGAFGLWYPETGDMWLDAYVTDVLSRARAAGYQVPDTAFRSALDNLHNQLNSQQDFDKDGGPVAYALYVLAREGAAAIGDLRYYADTKAEAFDTPIASAQLGAALAVYGDQPRADRMFKQAGAQIAKETGKESQAWRADYGTWLRDRLAVLALATEAGSKAVDGDALVGSVAGPLVSQNLSTQESAWALVAAHAALKGAETLGVTLDGAPVASPWLGLRDGDLAAGAAQVLSNGGTAPVSATVTVTGVPVAPGPAGGKGYAISRAWYTLDGAEVDPASVKQGTRMVAVIEVKPLGASDGRLMVNDPLPAGFEIDNPNLIRGGDIAALDWLETADTRTVEFRQDRFIAAVDWQSADPFRLAYIVRAISPGSYHLPAATVEDMYRPDYRAWTDAGSVTVAE